jgi:hypothetical protein
MLSKCILATLKFFDLQGYPLTAVEVHRYLLAPIEYLKAQMDSQYEISEGAMLETDEQPVAISLLGVWEVLDELKGLRQIGLTHGFYFLPGSQNSVYRRLRNYRFGVVRERRLRRWRWVLSNIPFIRAIAVAGSQPVGLQRPESDIDVLIVTHKKFLWLARSLVTVLLHVAGVRRHGVKVANRFCLNHYISKIKEVPQHRNIYTAIEYAKLRPFVNPGLIYAFQLANATWIEFFFPHAMGSVSKFLSKPTQGLVQRVLEGLLSNRLGMGLEQRIKDWWLPRIRTHEKYIVVSEDELSFHPDSKQEGLLTEFFKFYDQNNGETVQLMV